VPLEFVDEGHLICPRFICDTCRLPIDDARSAVVLWHPEQQDKLLFAHCGVCAKDRRYPYSRMLDDFLVQLLNNTGLEQDDLEKSRKTLIEWSALL
jgi:RNase P subunit RPR2